VAGGSRSLNPQRLRQLQLATCNSTFKFTTVSHYKVKDIIFSQEFKETDGRKEGTNQFFIITMNHES
jgi:hypothetical protein